MASLMNDGKGQMLVIFSLAVATILAAVSALHAQNLLAGVESSRTLMAFPKDDIRNLRIIAEESISRYCGLSVDQFYNKTKEISNQIRRLYSQKGVYADVISYLATPKSSVECYNVRIVYISGEIKFEDHLYCCRGRGCV